MASTLKPFDQFPVFDAQTNAEPNEGSARHGLSKQNSDQNGPTSAVRRANHSATMPSTRPGGKTRQISHQDADQASAMDAVRLIGAVSHEMRNPLNGILGMAHLLADTQLDGAQRNYLDGIQTSGTVLLTLVNDLLDLTALQSGKVAMTKAPSDIAQLVNQTLELAAPRAHSKGLGLGSFVDRALSQALDPTDGSASGPILSLDAGRVQQILTNLVSNAIKFTDEGGVRINANIEYDAADDAFLVFDVIDSGHGIALKDQNLVFAPFGRTQSALTQGTEGTGLGLPLSRGLAGAMGGELTLVRSQPQHQTQKPGDHGTHMRLRVPVDGARLPPKKRDTRQDDQPLLGETVLIASQPNFGHNDQGDVSGFNPCPELGALCDTLTNLGATVRVVGQASALNGPPQGVDHVLIDAQFDHAMLWARLCLPGTGVRPVTLLKPDQRSQLINLRDAGFGGYLIRPVRQSSLVAMLTDRFGSHEDDAFLADPVDALDDMSADTQRTQSILLADDNPVNALLAQKALEKAGHTVTVVDDGARAIAAVLERLEQSDGARSCFDTVILDLSMPVLDGFASARQMRSAGYKGRIVALSGNTDPDLESKLLAAGFEGFAQKPISPAALQKLVGSKPSAINA